MGQGRAYRLLAGAGGKVYIEVPDLAPERGSKGFGFFHFAHVIGFNHLNLILAAAQVARAPLWVAAPTGPWVAASRRR